jgi:RNA polymerase sigma-70 factor (ECF subfamily)
MFKKSKNSEDLQAFIKLLTEHQANLRAFIVSLMPGSSDVADVLQETNVVLWQKRNKFELGTDFIAWSFQIARYEVYRQRERNQRYNRIMFSNELVEQLSDVGMPSAAKGDIQTALDGCLEKLDADQLKLIQERYTPGHSLEEYANNSGRSAGSLRIALLRIRETLRHCVERTLASKSL